MMSQLIHARIRYPKILLLIATFAIAYLLFAERNIEPLHNIIISLGFFGAFLAGLMFTYGFTAAPSVAVFLILGSTLSISGIVAAGLIGGLGALVGDLIIFRLIRFSFRNEINRISHEKVFRLFYNPIKKIIPRKIMNHIVAVMGGIIIASPLPDEMGVSMIAAAGKISPKWFSLLSYALNTAGILIILIIGSSLA